MGSKMLIDAAHREETRVVVVRGNRIEEFDYESADRKQLKGNIYLAKVTRVEPSLQAAFVDYGGNRHGFLAFSEIHPDYYQIPVADRQALLAEEQEDEAVEAESQDSPAPSAKADSNGDDGDENGDDVEDTENVQTIVDDDPDEFEAVGDDTEDEEEVAEEAPKRRRTRQRRYRIQEVIKRRQIILVQVVKEERGNKGAALTTYLSLAGRYCVLMPNTARGGGISRKISDAKDRKRLKDVIEAVNVPEGAGLIVRTAGASRTKAEIKRDFDYLLRLWGQIRDLTLSSSAPSLVYEEGNLIKRSIRDLYNKEVDEVLVEGDGPYKDAKAFMKMLMPSHAKNVKHYSENRPLFSRFQVENQLDALYSPQITLPSGGYLVMNQTEALVAIDINSGKATREHSIEKTALKTNLEAAVEISRQLRLRDLAGLIVIDFIDMEERRNNRTVERKLKESLKTDRARIQVGRISHFGLLEMSRQRMRQSMLEGTTKPCSVCEGTGLIRSLSSSGLSILRTIEDHLINRKAENLKVRCQHEIACYILNEKRDHLVSIEQAYGISILIEPNENVALNECEILQGGSDRIVRKQGAPKEGADANGGQPSRSKSANEDDEENKSGGRKRRRRRRSRRPRRDENAQGENNNTEAASQPTSDSDSKKASKADDAQSSPDTTDENAGAGSDSQEQEKPKKRTRKPRKKRSEKAQAKNETGEGADARPEVASAVSESSDDKTQSQSKTSDEKPESDKPAKKPARKPRKKAAKKKSDDADAAPSNADSDAGASGDDGKEGKKAKSTAKAGKGKKKPTKKAVKKSKSDGADKPAPETSKASSSDNKPEEDRTTWTKPEATTKSSAPAKKGWWS